jgi:hypothetical protein
MPYSIFGTMFKSESYDDQTDLRWALITSLVLSQLWDKLWFSIITVPCRMNHYISCCVTSIARKILSQQLTAPALVVVLTPVDKVDAFPVFPHHVLEGAHHFPSFHDTMVVVPSVGSSRVLIWCRRWIPNAFIMCWCADDVLTFGSCWSLRLFEVVLCSILGYVGPFCLFPSTQFKIAASESKWDHWFVKRNPPVKGIAIGRPPQKGPTNIKVEPHYSPFDYLYVSLEIWRYLEVRWCIHQRICVFQNHQLSLSWCIRRW